MDALDAMTRGEIEYVILEEGDEFLQAAGDGAGPYALQFSPASGDGLEEVGGGVDGQDGAGHAAGLSPRGPGLAWVAAVVRAVAAVSPMELRS